MEHRSVPEEDRSSARLAQSVDRMPSDGRHRELGGVESDQPRRHHGQDIAYQADAASGTQDKYYKMNVAPGTRVSIFTNYLSGFVHVLTTNTYLDNSINPNRCPQAHTQAHPCSPTHRGSGAREGDGEKQWKEGRKRNSTINVLVVSENTCKIEKGRKKTKQRVNKLFCSDDYPTTSIT